MKDKLEQCTSIFNKPKEVLQDKKSKSKAQFCIENVHRKDYKIIYFDECMFSKSTESRCDFGLEFENNLYYIELKGNDNNKAMKQIINTHYNIKEYFATFDFKARIVAAKKQAPENLDKLNYRKLIKITKNDFKITQNKFLEII